MKFDHNKYKAQPVSFLKDREEILNYIENLEMLADTALSAMQKRRDAMWLHWYKQTFADPLDRAPIIDPEKYPSGSATENLPENRKVISQWTRDHIAKPKEG